MAVSSGHHVFPQRHRHGVPNIACHGIWEANDDGNELEIEPGDATARNLHSGAVLAGRPSTSEMLGIVETGGLHGQGRLRPDHAVGRFHGGHLRIIGPSSDADRVGRAPSPWRAGRSSRSHRADG